MELQAAIDNDDVYAFRQIIQKNPTDEFLALAIPQVVELQRGDMIMVLINLGNFHINQHILEEAVYHDNLALTQLLLENRLAQANEDLYDEAVEHDARVANLLKRYLR